MHTEDIKKRFNLRALYAVALALTTVVAIVGNVQFKRANDLELAMEGVYVRAFHDTVDYVRDINVMLDKAMLVGDPNQLASISADISMQAAAAKSSLGQLPVADAHLDNTSKFLSQVGDYTSYLSAKVIDSGEISKEEFQSLQDLSSYAQELSNNLLTMETDMVETGMRFTQVKNTSAQAENQVTLLSGMEQVEKEFQDYPTLIYDGPFSEHIEQMEPAALKGKPDVTQEQAAELVRYFIGEERAANLTFNGENENGLLTYAFSSQPDPKSDRTISAEVTKQNGMMLWFLDNRVVGEETIDWQRASEIGSQFLADMGYTGMKQSYYEKYDGVATLNYAYTDRDIIMYSDLIKVKVALDNGEIVGFESQGYIMSHQARDLPAPTLSEADAKARVNRHLTVDSVRLANIPKESKREVLCYECKGSFEDKHFLIYINAITGKEEKILMLLESEDGVLTM